jgi:phosphopantetheinyl transferase (holo-ACP synthase)
MPDRAEGFFLSGPELVTVGFGQDGGPVRVARMHDRDGAREVLAERLIPGWPARGGVVHDGLGRPLAAVPGFHLSYSRLHRPGAALIYGAACGNGRGILGLGIDAAQATEFGAAYPRERVFTVPELTLLGSRLFVAEEHGLLALAWACKEAAVKALGVGFHHCEPRDVVGVDCHIQDDRFAVRMRAACRNRISDVDCVAWVEAGSWIVVGLVRARGQESAHPGPGS